MALLLLLAVLTVAQLAAAPRAGATGYRYWSFWQAGSGGEWRYAQQGPAVNRPSDGDVEGWRYAVSEDSGSRAARPRLTTDFDAVCSGTPARGGTKRVAVLIDFGTPDDAARGEAPPHPGRRRACARVPKDATSADVLAAVAGPLRYDSRALLCAIAGYPEAGCGEAVRGDSDGKGDGDSDGNGDGKSGGNGGGRGAADRGATPRRGAGGPQDGDTGGRSLGLLAGGSAVALLAAAAVWRARRRSP